jgi:hypothetical protein
VNRAARRRGFTVGGAEVDSYLDFIDPLDALVADQKRRRDGSKLADPLIDALDQIAVRQWSQPGGVDVSSAPEVEAVVARGDDAVPALLDAVEHDDRLTRSVQFWRDFSRHRHLLTVSEAACVALAAILGTRAVVDWRDLRTPDGRRRAAASLRAFHTSHRTESREQRWFAVLADDHASYEQWCEAAEHIAPKPEPVFERGWNRPASPPASPLPGEALRARRDPSVTELLVRRLRVLVRDRTTSRTSPLYRNDVITAGAIATALGRWDARGAARVLRAEIRRCERIVARDDDGYAREHAALVLSRHVDALDRAGDRSAIRRFVRWLRRIEPSRFGSNVESVFDPLVARASEPEVDAFLRWAFHHRASPYQPLLLGPTRVDRLIASALVRTRPFRERLLADLADLRGVGEVVAGRNGYVELERFGGYAADLPAGTRLPLRYADVIAWLLERALPADAPRVQPHLSVEVRDRALTELRAYIAKQRDV